VILLIIALGFVFLQPLAPHKELKKARMALSLAQKSGAEEYASSLYVQAKQLYDSAMKSWVAQNEYFFLRRDYKPIHNIANLSIEKSIEAEEQALERIKNSNVIAKNKIEELDKKVMLYNKVYKQMPLPDKVTRAHNVGVMKQAEARIAFESGRYNEFFESYYEAAELVNTSNLQAENILKNWFLNYPKWRQLATDAIHLSKAGRTTILVDKMAHQCIIYKNGKILKSFNAEFGSNWMGDKHQKGDKATPEGVYCITQKKEGSHTKFYRALLINYPNEDDKKRFDAEKEKGIFSFRTHIGNLIEIHGFGGKGIDWTDGCIALNNQDMDALYHLVDKGTSVFIVGSLQTLNEIYK
jgi:lipoprotein-anchoring transpeptidase ErfK/SrfK